MCGRNPGLHSASWPNVAGLIRCYRYDPCMSVDVWIGAVTTLAGAGLGGLISFVLSRQQITEARRQRLEEAQRSREQTSKERRFDCYVEFLSGSRSYRNALRSIGRERRSGAQPSHFDSLAADADAASSRVFLVVESAATYDACRSVVHAIGVAQESLHGSKFQPDSSKAVEINERMAASLRHFQAAARDELKVTGVDASRILGTQGG
jgi:hypothetical protein